jgi:hypothetical protein
MHYGYHDLIGSMVDCLVLICEMYECVKHWINIRYGLNQISCCMVPMTTLDLLSCALTKPVIIRISVLYWWWV